MVRAEPTRRAERGAALFIVMMVITVVSAVGVFSVRKASLIDRAAGWARRASQTAYLSELGTRLVIADMADKQGFYHDRLNLKPGDLLAMPTGEPPRCSENADLHLQRGDQAVQCLPMNTKGLYDLALSMLQGSAFFANQEELAGELGRPFGSVEQRQQPMLYLELTQSNQDPTPVAGMSVASSQVHQLTVMTRAQIRPPAGAIGACDENSLAAAGVGMARGYIRYVVPSAQ